MLRWLRLSDAARNGLHSLNRISVSATSVVRHQAASDCYPILGYRALSQAGDPGRATSSETKEPS